MSDLPELALRRATPSDAALLSLLGQATFLVAFAHDHPGPAMLAHLDSHHSAEAYQALLADPESAVWLLETRLRAPIGYAVLSRPKMDIPTGPEDLELKRIYVLPGYQRGGHGQALLDSVVAEASARGATRLLLCVYRENRKARAFYERNGFAQIGEQGFMVGSVRFGDLVLARAI